MGVINTGFRDGVRKLLSQCRSIPGQLGLRPYRVSFIVDTWSGSENLPGYGTSTQVETPITEANGMPPKVTHPDHRRLALGMVETGTIYVGPVTPVASAPWATLLQSSISQGQSLKMKLVHIETGGVLLCTIEHIEDEKSLNIKFTCRIVDGSA